MERPRIQVSFGELYTLPKIDRKNRDVDLQHNTDEIMCRIAALLPPKYRGVYADYERVQELLDSDSEKSEIWKKIPWQKDRFADNKEQ